MPEISVLLCTRNRGDKIINAVDSILENSYKNFELIIVDQSSDDKTKTAIETYSDSRIRYIRSQTVGLSRSRNIAIRESLSDIVAFTDDDCIVDREWLASIMKEYGSDSSVMGVYGRVLPYGKGEPSMVCHCIIDSMERKTVDSPIIPYTVLGHGNNMSFRKNVFRKTGLYIESLGAGTWMRAGEDTDLTYLALRKRIKFLYSPKPLVYHNNWMSKEKGENLELGYILAAVAVFTKYSLKMDKIAISHLLVWIKHILKKITSNLLNLNKDRGLVPEMKKLWWFNVGFIMGLKYIFVTPPKLK
jgi:glycosyltransferase involved in cell wall biosynthesis